MKLLASLTDNEVTHVYDWLADTGSTYHITNRQELFRTYEPTPEATVQGVGGIRSQVLGRGTITVGKKTVPMFQYFGKIGLSKNK